MVGFREILVKEEKKLAQELQVVQERLKDAPEGKLRLSKNKNSTQYYRCFEGEKKNRIYISYKNKELIQKLAQKSYDEKVQKLIEKRLRQIQKITKDYRDNEIEKIYEGEHIERKKLVHPIELPWEQQIEEWKLEKYTGKEFQDNTPVILTEQGERVRSKSEKILADYFFRNGIAYKYERPLYLKKYGIVYPDFTVLSRKTKKEVYWEHEGKMDDSGYAQSAVKKIHTYEENGIFPGERLILTFETSQTGLNMRVVERLTAKYL